MSDLDLFGREVIHPMKAEQLPLFHEPNAAAPVRLPGETTADQRIARKFADTPTASMFPPKLPAERKPTLCQRIEAELKRRNIPYVSVTEARRALFASKTIDVYFHLVIYSQTGDNWLLLCGEAGENNRRAMTDWQAIFSDGFKAVFAVERAAGIVFKTLTGEKLKLDECAP